MHSFTNATRICIPDVLQNDEQQQHPHFDDDDIRYSDNLGSGFFMPRQQHDDDPLLCGSLGGADSPSSRAPPPLPPRTRAGTTGAGRVGAHRTPKTHFAMLGEQLQMFRPESGSVVLSTRSAEDNRGDHLQQKNATNPSSACERTGIRGVAAVIAGCFGFRVVALLVFCSSSYRNMIQSWILTWMEPYIQPYQTKEDVAGFVYLLCCGIVPTLLACLLWHAFKGNKLLYVAFQSDKLSHFLRQKPTIWRPVQCFSSSGATHQHDEAVSPDSPSSSPSSSPPTKYQLYIDATWGELGFMLLMLVSVTILFIEVLVVEGISSLSSTSTVFRAMGKSFGYICLFTMVWLLLPVDKTSFWMEFFHLPHPLGMKYRRWLGTLTLAFGVLHCVCHAITFYLRDEFVSQLLPHFGAIYQDTPIRDSNGINGVGEVALAAMIVTGIASLPVFRKKCYAAYLSIQQICGTIAVLSVCVHYPQGLWWLFPSVVLFVTQKIVAGSHSRYPVEIVDMAPLPNGMTRLVCRRAKQSQSQMATFTPGQFVYLYASRISWFQWHPFYVASSPSAHDDTFKVYAQACGDWTESFFDLSKLAYATQEAPAIYADGFYGPSLPIYYEQYGCLVLIAEGIGVTGVIAMLEELFFKAQARQVARESGDCSGDANNWVDASASHQVWFLWVCKDICLFKEFEELLTAIREFDPSEEHFRLRLFLTKIPAIQEIRYKPPMPCIFGNAADNLLFINKTDSKKTAKRSEGCEHHSVDMDAHEDALRSPRPQNKSGCFRFKSRPFQAAAASPLYQVLVVLVVFAATLVLAIHVEWQDHQHGSGIFGGEAEETEGMFRPMHRIACVLVIFMGCLSAYLLIICEEFVKAITKFKACELSRRTRRGNQGAVLKKRVRRQTCGTECEPRSACATTMLTSSTTRNSATHFVEMSPYAASHLSSGQVQDDHDYDLDHVLEQSEGYESHSDDGERSNSDLSGSVSIVSEEASHRSALDLEGSFVSITASIQEPDILEKLSILSFRPNVDKFMATVAKSYFAYSAETIAVFACGNPKFVSTSEAAVHVAGEQDSKAAYHFHRMDFRV